MRGDVRDTMDLPSYFNDMLSEIRPSQELLEECARAHTDLREFLVSDPDLKDIIVTTFLQGSYRRSTLVRPAGGSKPDVDVVVVTNLDPNSRTPAEVQNIFCRVLDKHPDYRGNYQRQGRSIGLSHGPVNLDVVITAAPSEVLKGILKSESFGAALTVEAGPAWMLRKGQALGGQDWKSEPLLIPDRDANRWEKTDPISQIEWTHDKNQRTHGHYVNVVKAIKWWWAQNSSGGEGNSQGLPHRAAGRAALPGRNRECGLRRHGHPGGNPRYLCRRRAARQDPFHSRRRHPYQQRLQADTAGIIPGLPRVDQHMRPSGPGGPRRPRQQYQRPQMGRDLWERVSHGSRRGQEQYREVP